MENRAPIFKASPEFMIRIVWNSHGFHVLDCLPKGQKGNASYFISDILAAIWEKFSVAEDDGDRRLLVHTDHARPHIARLVQTFCDENFIQMALHPPYSADLTHSDFWPFGDVKKQIIGQSFEAREEVFGAELQSVF
jgi:hypothetical protein